MVGLLLHNARLIDGTGCPPLPIAAVLIGEGKFAWVGDVAEAPNNESAVRVDLGGGTICPGFFDCHVHLSLPGPSASLWDRLQVLLSYHTFQLVERLRVTLNNGVTTVRDLMGIDAGVRQVRDDPLEAIDSMGDPTNILLVLKEGQLARDDLGLATASAAGSVSSPT